MKRLLVLLMVGVAAFALTGLALAAASTTDFEGNGVNADGTCASVTQDPTLAAGTQVWHFVLTSPDPGPWELTATFTNSGTKTATGEQQGGGNSAVFFFVTTSAGDTLVSASSENGGGVLTVSDCTANTTPPPTPGGEVVAAKPVTVAPALTG
jgi:hypothetical protein